MGKLIYIIFISLYPIIIRIASLFNEKARLWIDGRKGIFERLREDFNTHPPTIWMHCASLGEFEQGRPVLEKLRSEWPRYKILLTFFSPSGYEVRKKYNGADYIYYLPADNAKNADFFLELVQPKLILFVKYEFWNYYLQEARKRKVPLLLVSGIFRKSQPFFKFYGQFHTNMLRCFTHLFVQDTQSLLLLQSIGVLDGVSLAGDTRFDRVVEIAERHQPVPAIENFCLGSNVIVAGSTWLEDDEKLALYANSRTDLKFIIASHNISKDRLDECKGLYKNSVLFSELSGSTISPHTNTIIIDNIGMLSSLYNYATIAYVGGGFGSDGVHNVLEAAVYGKPVIFGSQYSKFVEAVELIENGGGVSVTSSTELEIILNNLLTNKKEYSKASEASRQYVYSKKGATEKILIHIYENRLLTN